MEPNLYMRASHKNCQHIPDKLQYNSTYRINWDCYQSGYTENPDNWIFLRKWATCAVSSSTVTVYSS